MNQNTFSLVGLDRRPGSGLAAAAEGWWSADVQHQGAFYVGHDTGHQIQRSTAVRLAACREHGAGHGSRLAAALGQASGSLSFQREILTEDVKTSLRYNSSRTTMRSAASW